MSDTLEFQKPELEPITALVNVETRERYPVTRDKKITIGRAEDNTLSLANDVYTSGRHAELYFNGDQCYVRDLDSRNGTYKNNEPVVGEVPVVKGDIVTFGRTKFELA
jgi:pSer/pThr/pTyr-binding forkhead associated (FHA) protein